MTSVAQASFILGIVSGSLICLASVALYQSRQKRSAVKHDLCDLVGNTPIVRLHSLSEETGCEILAKCEYLNPCGSSKDRVARIILLTALKQGLVSKGGTVVEASSGSTGISLTRLAHSLGLGSLIVIPDDQAAEKIALLRKLGASVELVKPASIVHPDHNVNVAKRRAKEMSNAFFANQFENPANALAQEETGKEIFQQVQGRIDAFVMSAGTAGTLAGVASYLKSRLSNVLVVLADPQGSSLTNAVKHGVLYTPEQSEKALKRHRIDTIVEGVGLDRLTNNLSKALTLIDDAIRVTDAEVVAMSRRLLREEGFFVGSSSALNCSAALKLAKKLGPGHRIVTIFCSSGEREVTKLYDDDFCKAKGLM
jgi:cysteine synthase